MINCLIFDFDGTLADTNEGIVRTFQETLKAMGIPDPGRERITSTIGLCLKDGFKAGVDGLTDEQADEAVVTYRRFFDNIAIPLTTGFPGAVEVTEELFKRGYLMLIATSRSTHSLNVLAKNIGVADFFHASYTADDVIRHKPAPDLALLALEKHNVKGENALVIGDTIYDLKMGKDAGCKVCGVTWGNQTREQLETAHPDYIIDTLEELFEVLDKENS